MRIGQFLSRLVPRVGRRSSSDRAELGVDPDELPTEDEFLAGVYWHSTSANATNFLFHNVWVGGGRLDSMSATRRAHGDRLITFGDLYPLIGELAEAAWEEVRARHYPEKPSRNGALFLFENASDAAVASSWRPDSQNVVLEARIFRTAGVHRGDLRWFSCPEAEWKDAASRYWSGEGNPDGPAIWECMVDGEVFFPNWKEPPFGRFGLGTASRPEISIEEAEIVTCPHCRIEFRIMSSNSTIFNTADRSRCLDDPNLPILNDCPHVAPLVESAWARQKQRTERMHAWKRLSSADGI